MLQYLILLLKKQKFYESREFDSKSAECLHPVLIKAKEL